MTLDSPVAPIRWTPDAKLHHSDYSPLSSLKTNGMRSPDSARGMVMNPKSSTGSACFRFGLPQCLPRPRGGSILQASA